MRCAAVAARGVVDGDLLRDALALLGREIAARLGLEFEFVALFFVLFSSLALPPPQWDKKTMWMEGETVDEFFLPFFLLLTFVTASWKWSSEMGCAVLFENENSMSMAGDDAVARLARNSVRMLPSVIVPRSSRGSCCCCCADDSGRAEEKFHSSSSAAAGCLPVLLLFDCDMKAANGSEAGGGGGAATAAASGFGVVDCDADGEANDMNWLLRLLLLPEAEILLLLL